MERGVKRASMRSYVRWWINSGHNVWSRCRGGICVLGAGGTLGWGLMVRARIQGFLGNCAVGEGAVGPAAVEVGGEGVWLGLLAVGSLVERERA